MGQENGREMGGGRNWTDLNGTYLGGSHLIPEEKIRMADLGLR